MLLSAVTVLVGPIATACHVPLTGGHWFFLPGMYCWQMGKWALPKQDMAQTSLCIRQVARLLRSLHDTFAEVSHQQLRQCNELCTARTQGNSSHIEDLHRNIHESAGLELSSMPSVSLYKNRCKLA